MFKVEVQGFKTKEQAQAFVNWYLISGEGDVKDFASRNSLAAIGSELHPFKSCNVDSTTFPFKWQDDTLPMILNVS
jgi:hypothetical protein